MNERNTVLSVPVYWY